MATAAVTAGTVVASPDVRVSRSLWSNAWWKLRHDKLTIAAMAFLILLAALSILAPVFADHLFHYKFEQQDLFHTYERPTFDPPAYLLGSDEVGRSQVVRLLFGGQVSLFVGFVAAIVNFAVGVPIGLAAGYYRGAFDDFITWVITTLNGIPQLFLLLIIAALWQPGPLTLILIIGLLNWTGITLYVRGQTISLREREYVTSAHAIGASDARVMFKHILPNVLPLIFVLAAIDVGAIVLLESALSFLGLGILPPTPSWGNMLTNGASYFVRAWWLVVSPGVMIFVTVLCLYLIGDGLRDALDPRLKTDETH
ncbi:MAG TPA: peptide ABC transporter permease [Chloroflexi bacterium]|nr:peptide ABC transporter permease [Chloroflexota bacterium]HAL26812.1 peptide ABC transporter permease [Chloroflexota bacterium]